MPEENKIQGWKLTELESLVDLPKNPSATKKKQIKIAILADHNIDFYVKSLVKIFALEAYDAQIYQSQYNIFEQEILNNESNIYKAKPDYIILFPCIQSLEEKILCLGPEYTSQWMSETKKIWHYIEKNSKAKIIQHNFCIPIFREFGNQSATIQNSIYNQIIQLNSKLVNEANIWNIKICDTEFQAAFYGKKNWLDHRLWCHGKIAIHPDYLMPLAKNIRDIIFSIEGKITKCLVLDLDNTLWGGILGDDSIYGIEIGENDLGKAFAINQTLFKKLKERGIILAISSKNEWDKVLEVFEKHPEMKLNKKDIAFFSVHYNDKVSSIKQIKKELNIGYDSIVFLDDSVYERELVRTYLPEVQVPDLPEDPADLPKFLARWNLFESPATTEEDLKRTKNIQNQIEFNHLIEKTNNIEDFLKNLQMKIQTIPLSELTFSRAEQLIQRSNQFNLRTKRYDLNEIKEIAQKNNYISFCIRLSDKMGFNSIISVVICEILEEALFIDTWVMSCQALSRRVEEFTIKKIIDTARKLQKKLIIGEFIPSEKNSLVQNLYLNLGFKKINHSNQRYLLNAKDYTKQNLPFEELE